MATLAELKKGIAPLKKAKTETKKQVRVEIDLEKAAIALRDEPVDGIEKADENADADELAKSLTGRISQIQTLLEKAEEDEDGNVFVVVDEDDALAKEFAFDKKPKKSEKEEDEEKSKTKKDEEGDEDGDPADLNKADDDAWPTDFNGKAERRRRLTKGERVVSTDPSARQARREAKRDAVAKRRAERNR